jgi:hypothetical protein
VIPPLSFMLEPLNSLDTDSYIEKVFATIPLFLAHLLSSLSGDQYLVQSEMILSLMYLQFNIDEYIPHIHVSIPIIFLTRFGNTGTVDIQFILLFFSSYLLPFRMQPEECLIMIWIASLSLSLYYSFLRIDPL